MNITDFHKCSNCGACYSVCPQQAITIEADTTFYRPVINHEKCINCGLCYKVCPVNNENDYEKPTYAYAGWHKDMKVLHESSSGGVFYGLAQKVITERGVVFSAVYSDDCMDVYFTSSDDIDISKLQKSKYVESLVGNTFSRIQEELMGGRTVLFCGTPCQVAGLKAFLNRKYDNLITCDFACGGLPSHKMYQEHLHNLEARYGATVQSVDFRPKTHGWRRYAILVRFDNGKIYNRLGKEDDYLRSFLYGKYTVRDYCLECKFSDQHHSDLTIADFWLNTKLSKLDNYNGVSLIICNTLKGKEIIEQISPMYILEELSVSEVTYNHKKTSASLKDRENHDSFVQLYEEKGFEQSCKVHLPFPLKDRVKYYLRRIVLKSRGSNK